jgi:high-affinity nickel-transport protein
VLTAIALGLLLGLRHAADPDHVLAVSAIVARHRHPRAAAWVGLAWGLGHGATAVLAGGAIVALGLAVPEGLGLAFEGAVGLTLIALGLANLRRAARADARDAHAPHAGAAPAGRSRLGSFGVGVVHGLAGTAALALLALAAMPTPAAAIAYLAVFALGTTLGMVAVSLGIGGPLGWAVARPGGRRAVAFATGALAVAFGGWLVAAAGHAQGWL